MVINSLGQAQKLYGSNHSACTYDIGYVKKSRVSVRFDLTRTAFARKKRVKHARRNKFYCSRCILITIYYR